MSIASPVTDSKASHRWDALFIVLIAMLVHVRCLQVPFQMDDGFGIPRAAAHLGLGDWPPFNSPEEDALLASSNDPMDFTWDSGWYFRPMLWVSWHGLTVLGGGIARPWLFHSYQIMVFAIGCGILTAVLGRQLSRGAAFGGGLLAAVTHASSQAITWSSALGDTLALTLALGAVLPLTSFLRTGGSLSWISTMILIALAQLSKETAVALVPMVGLLAFGVVRSSPRRVAGVLAVAAGLVVALIARAVYTGTLTPHYMGALQPHADWIRGGVELALDVIAPWNRSPGIADSAPFLAHWGGSITFVTVAAVAVTMPVVAACVHRRPGTTSRLIAGLAVFALALGPALLLPASSNNYNSRALHGATAAFAVVMAFAFDAFFRANRGKFLSFAIVLPLLIVVVDSSCHVARTELSFATRLEQQRDSLDQATRNLPPGCVALALHAEDTFHGFPMLGTFAGAFLNPPFVDAPRSVIMRRDWGSVAWTPNLVGSATSVRLIESVDGRFLQRGTDIQLPPDTARLGSLDPETMLFGDSRSLTTDGVLKISKPRRGTTTRLADGIALELAPHPASRNVKTLIVRLALPALETAAGVALAYAIDATATRVQPDGALVFVMHPLSLTPTSIETTRGPVSAESLAQRLALVNATDPAPALLAIDFLDTTGRCIASSDWTGFRGILAQ